MMAKWFPIVFLLAAPLRAQAAAASSAKADARLRCLLDRPLVVGASMSGKYSATDPGTLLAEKHGTAGRVTRRVIAHTASPDILATVTDLDLSSATLVIALDLFFWDSREGDCGEASARVLRFSGRVKRAGSALAIATIPVTGGDCGEAVSGTIAETCLSNAGRCALVDLRTPSVAAAAGGGLWVEGEWFPDERLSPDEFHPSPLASLGIAQALEQALKDSGIACP